MRKLVVSEWMTLDGVIDAGTIKQWFDPFDSTSPAFTHSQARRMMTSYISERPLQKSKMRGVLFPPSALYCCRSRQKCLGLKEWRGE